MIKWTDSWIIGRSISWTDLFFFVRITYADQKKSQYAIVFWTNLTETEIQDLSPMLSDCWGETDLLETVLSAEGVGDLENRKI